MNEGFIQFFELADAIRRAQGESLGMLGFGPTECSYRTIASNAHWRLRQYSGQAAGPSVLIVAAPIKRPYIWDISPSVSALRYCLRHGLHIHLLEWTPPSRRSANGGLAEYADDAISAAVGVVSRETGSSRPFLMGHSLGGTLAAIFAAIYPDRLSGLVLLSAPLCFEPGVSSFRDTLAAIIPSWAPETEVVPGSLLSQLSAASAPRAFVWSRLVDALASAGDPRASDVRSRIERWALDEAPLSGPLFRDIFGRLYRENQLCNGTLVIRGRAVRPSRVHVPVLAVANVADEVAPPGSVKPFLDAVRETVTRLIEYPGEAGVVLQHLGILVGRDAFARIWPEIVGWIKDHVDQKSEVPVRT